MFGGPLDVAHRVESEPEVKIRGVERTAAPFGGRNGVEDR
jgi:hypothetical protein